MDIEGHIIFLEHYLRLKQKQTSEIAEEHSMSVVYQIKFIQEAGPTEKIVTVAFIRQFDCFKHMFQKEGAKKNVSWCDQGNGWLKGLHYWFMISAIWTRCHLMRRSGRLKYSTATSEPLLNLLQSSVKHAWKICGIKFAPIYPEIAFVSNKNMISLKWESLCPEDYRNSAWMFCTRTSNPCTSHFRKRIAKLKT